MTGTSCCSRLVVSRFNSLRGRLIAPGRCSSSYSSRSSTSMSCAPFSSSLCRSSLNMPIGIGLSPLQCLSEHLCRWGTLQAFGCCVDPTAKAPLIALWGREQVAPVHSDRRTTGEPKPAGLFISVDRNQRHVGFYALLGQDLSKGVLRRPVARTAVEVQKLHLQLVIPLTDSGSARDSSQTLLRSAGTGKRAGSSLHGPVQ